MNAVRDLVGETDAVGDSTAAWPAGHYELATETAGPLPGAAALTELAQAI
jgi:hypothetical protein